MAPNSVPSGWLFPKPPLSKSRTKKPMQAPQPVIKKLQAPYRRRESTESNAVLSKKKQALELENRLESSLAVVADRITSLTKNIVARQTNPKLMKERQLMLYVTRLRVVSEELKSQLMTMGKCSKMSNQQDQKSLESSYQRTLHLWREYQRVSGCVAQHGRIWRQRRKESGPATDESSRPSVMSSSSEESVQRTADDSITQ